MQLTEHLIWRQSQVDRCKCQTCGTRSPRITTATCTATYSRLAVLVPEMPADRGLTRCPKVSHLNLGLKVYPHAARGGNQRVQRPLSSCFVYLCEGGSHLVFGPSMSMTGLTGNYIAVSAIIMQLKKNKYMFFFQSCRCPGL